MVFDEALEEDQMDALQQVITLYNAMLDRARCAIHWWGMVGQRHRVVKDMRVKIAKMAWEEVWAWCKKSAPAKQQRKKAKTGVSSKPKRKQQKRNK